MKRILMAGAILLASAAIERASDSRPPRPADDGYEAEARRWEKDMRYLTYEVKPNEAKVGNFTCSGIVVQAAKTTNLLQLVNPAAPPEYGAAEDNVVRDPINGKMTGLKMFSVRF